MDFTSNFTLHISYDCFIEDETDDVIPYLRRNNKIRIVLARERIHVPRLFVCLYIGVLCHMQRYFSHICDGVVPREDAGGLSREYVLRIPGVS